MTAKYSLSSPQELKVTLDMDQVDAIVGAEMNYLISRFSEDWLLRTNGDGFGIFDSDPAKDIKHIEEHIAAFKLVLDWVGLPETNDG
jgi:hypothetical protein|tara:strand:+ start:7870 stop:8130 length:261 start_codon:yes stop_codon:yes gene_type:complete